MYTHTYLLICEVMAVIVFISQCYSEDSEKQGMKALNTLPDTKPDENDSCFHYLDARVKQNFAWLLSVTFQTYLHL